LQRLHFRHRRRQQRELTPSSWRRPKRAAEVEAVADRVVVAAVAVRRQAAPSVVEAEAEAVRRWDKGPADRWGRPAALRTVALSSAAAAVMTVVAWIGVPAVETGWIAARAAMAKQVEACVIAAPAMSIAHREEIAAASSIVALEVTAAVTPLFVIAVAETWIAGAGAIALRRGSADAGSFGAPGPRSTSTTATITATANGCCGGLEPRAATTGCIATAVAVARTEAW
jgi:hypothetical protein